MIKSGLVIGIHFAIALAVGSVASAAEPCRELEDRLKNRTAYEIDRNYPPFHGLFEGQQLQALGECGPNLCVARVKRTKSRAGQDANESGYAVYDSESKFVNYFADSTFMSSGIHRFSIRRVKTSFRFWGGLDVRTFLEFTFDSASSKLWYRWSTFASDSSESPIACRALGRE